jgi:hypothetical protein
MGSVVDCPVESIAQPLGEQLAGATMHFDFAALRGAGRKIEYVRWPFIARDQVSASKIDGFVSVTLNAGRKLGTKRALKTQRVWAIRSWLDRERPVTRSRDVRADCRCRTPSHYYTRRAASLGGRFAARAKNLARGAVTIPCKCA